MVKAFKKKSNDKVVEWINPSRRERRREQTTYSVDDYYKEIIGGGSKSASKQTPQPKAPRAPKVIHGQDFQFFPKELDALQEKEQLYFKKKVNYKVTSYDITGDIRNEGSDAEEEEGEYKNAANTEGHKGHEELKRRIEEEQEKINSAPDFTQEDELRKQELISKAFTNWNKRTLWRLSTPAPNTVEMIWKTLRNLLIPKHQKRLKCMQKYSGKD